MQKIRSLLAPLLLTCALASASAQNLWETLPAPQPLPTLDRTGSVDHDGVRIWYGIVGSGSPVVMLHGGRSTSNAWGSQVPALVAAHHRVILIDSRGHGRSTWDHTPLSFTAMEGDVIAVLDALGIKQTAVVGWSDGAIISLIMAMQHPARVTRVYAFGANVDTKSFIPGAGAKPILAQAMAMAKEDYMHTSPAPQDYGDFSKAVFAMQSTQPNYTAADLAGIHGVRVAIVDGDHEEFITRAHTEYIAHTISGAKLILLPNVGHFAPLQDPTAFNQSVIDFLK